MAAPVPSVGIVGLRALQRDLTRLAADNGDLNRAFQQAGREAAEPIAAIARGAFPQDSGTLANDVRVTASRSGAAVRAGRASIRYAGWVEFGGHRRAPHESERAYDPRGRYLFPAAAQLSPRAAQTYGDALNRALGSVAWTNPPNTNPESVHD